MNISICTKAHAPLHVYMYIHTYTCSRSHEFTPTHPTPAHPHKVISCFSPSTFACVVFCSEVSGSQHPHIPSFAQSCTTSETGFRIVACIPLCRINLPKKDLRICLESTPSSFTLFQSCPGLGYIILAIFICYLAFFLFLPV